jgi:hypothetical protein
MAQASRGELSITRGQWKKTLSVVSALLLTALFCRFRRMVGEPPTPPIKGRGRSWNSFPARIYFQPPRKPGRYAAPSKSREESAHPGYWEPRSAGGGCRVTGWSPQSPLAQRITRRPMTSTGTQTLQNADGRLLQPHAATCSRRPFGRWQKKSVAFRQIPWSRA